MLEYCEAGDLRGEFEAAALAAAKRVDAAGSESNGIVKAFGLSRTRFYTSSILLALRFLHEHGFIHRSLTLENVLLGSDGHVKVAGFMTAAEGVRGPYATTRTFCGGGTDFFMAPEVGSSPFLSFSHSS